MRAKERDQVLGQPPAQVRTPALGDLPALGRKPVARVLLEGELGAARLWRAGVHPPAEGDHRLLLAELCERRGAVRALTAVAEGDVAPLAHGDRDIGRERRAAVAEALSFELCASWSCHLTSPPQPTRARGAQRSRGGARRQAPPRRPARGRSLRERYGASGAMAAPRLRGARAARAERSAMAHGRPAGASHRAPTRARR
jgi:hypothetical protein